MYYNRRLYPYLLFFGDFDFNLHLYIEETNIILSNDLQKKPKYIIGYSRLKIKTDMGKLSPIWFLLHPLDQEHKTYVLLDHLKNLHKGICGNQIREVLQDVFYYIEDLKKFKKELKLTEESESRLSESEREILFLHQERCKENGCDLIGGITSTALEILYKYANTGLDILQEHKEKIKTFEVSPPGGFDVRPNFGIFLIRNLVTDEILPYYWVETHTGVLMKKIKTVTPVYYSMSYVWIAHEILEKIDDVERGETPRILVGEISEDFAEDSESVFEAKKIIVKKISGEDRKNKA